MNAPIDKTPAPEPEIPDELKAKLGRPKRPGGYRPKSEAAEDDNPAADEPEERKVRNTAAFFKKLAVVLKDGVFYRTIIEEHDRKVLVPGSNPKRYETLREKVAVKIAVELMVGEDGLPYTSGPVSADETRRLRNTNYADAPKMVPSHGDLTPDFSEWLYLNHPYDAAVRYAGRSTHVQVAAATSNL